jgi:hypothetical protein
VADVMVFEQKRDAPSKLLRVIVHFQAAPPSQEGAVQVTADSRPFADVQFIRCTGSDCFGEKQISAADVAMLEGTKSLEIKTQNISVSSPIGNFAEVRTGRGKTVAELNEELSELMTKRGEERNREFQEKIRKSDEGIEQCKKDKGKKDKAGDPDDFGYYCHCMNRKMEGNETRSIAQWEKANPAAWRACER